MSFLRRNSQSSVTADQPGYSILLNGNNSPQTRPRASSTVSTFSSTSASTSSTSPNRPTFCNKVSFAPLPEVPPELKRRSSIALGVATRKNLLSNQGNTVNGGGLRGGAGGNAIKKGNVVYMTDEEWEHYKKQYESKNDDVVDLGELAKSSAKSLWRKVRSSSQSSQSSQSSSTSSIASPRSTRRTLQSDISGSPPPGTPSFGLDTVSEESDATREKVLALHLEHVFLHEGGGHGDGDATPRRRPSPPPPIRTDSLDEEEEEEEQTRPNVAAGRRVVDDSALLKRSGERDRAVLGFSERKGNTSGG